jgi:hypothetical protein
MRIFFLSSLVFWLSYRSVVSLLIASLQVIMFIESCSGFPVYNRIVFGSHVLTRLIIGSGSCWTRLHNRVSQVDTNPTREPELSNLHITLPFKTFCS